MTASTYMKEKLTELEGEIQILFSVTEYPKEKTRNSSFEQHFVSTWDNSHL